MYIHILWYIFIIKHLWLCSKLVYTLCIGLYIFSLFFFLLKCCEDEISSFNWKVSYFSTSLISVIIFFLPHLWNIECPNSFHDRGQQFHDWFPVSDKSGLFDTWLYMEWFTRHKNYIKKSSHIELLYIWQHNTLFVILS